MKGQVDLGIFEAPELKRCRRGFGVGMLTVAVARRESLHHSILPSFMSLSLSLLDGLLCVRAFLLVDACMAFIAKAEQPIHPAERKPSHLVHRGCRFDWYDVMHAVSTSHDALLLAFLAKWIGSQLLDAKLLPLLRVVDDGFVLRLLRVLTSPR